MPIVYVHGVAIRDEQPPQSETDDEKLFDLMSKNITWPIVEGHLRKHVAPVLSANPDSVALLHAYWGDLGGKLAWDGASCLSKDYALEHDVLNISTILDRSKLAIDLRYPLNHLIAYFMGDVFTYLANRGDAENPGAIPCRILDILFEASEIKKKTGEPLVALTNSLGCEIMYDIVTYFLPKIEKYRSIKVDFWCGVASQVGLFEELKLFLASNKDYSGDKGNRVPFPPSEHLGAWWNVWDIEDVISFSVGDIIEGVDDNPYRVGKTFLDRHIGYLQEERFYETLAKWIGTKLSARNDENWESV